MENVVPGRTHGQWPSTSTNSFHTAPQSHVSVTEPKTPTNSPLYKNNDDPTRQSSKTRGPTTRSQTSSGSSSSRHYLKPSKVQKPSSRHRSAKAQSKGKGHSLLPESDWMDSKDCKVEKGSLFAIADALRHLSEVIEDMAGMYEDGVC